MIRIAITAEAFDAIEGTLPIGTVAFERQRTASGGVFVWLDRRTADKLFAERCRGEEVSDVIVRVGGSPVNRPGAEFARFSIPGQIVAARRKCRSSR